MTRTQVRRMIRQIAATGGVLAVAAAILGIGVTVVGFFALVNIVIALAVAGNGF
jgi:hypothetical protein